jgi:hypothetical protein
LWEEGENGCGRRLRMVMGGGREWLWEEGEDGHRRREIMVVGGRR